MIFCTRHFLHPSHLISAFSLKASERKQWCFNDTGGGREKEPSLLIFFVAYVCHWWSRVFECQCLSAQWCGTSASNLIYTGGVMGRAEERQVLKAGAGSNSEKGAAAVLVLSPVCSYFIFANSIAEQRSRYWEWFKGACYLLLARGPRAFRACLCSHFMLVMLFSVISLACPRFLRFIQLLCLSFPALLEMFPSLLLCVFRTRNVGT